MEHPVAASQSIREIHKVVCHLGTIVISVIPCIRTNWFPSHFNRERVRELAHIGIVHHTLIKMGLRMFAV